MSVVRIELGMIEIHLSGNLGNPDNRRRVAVAVEKEDLVSNPHLTHVVAGLIVADSIPMVRGRRGTHQGIKAKSGRLGLHQPVACNGHWERFIGRQPAVV